MGQRKDKRAPFGTTLPRSVKKAAGRTDVERTTLAIRTAGVDLTEEIERYVHARMGAKLGAVADRIERLTVRFDDVNGPRGGVDKRCRVKVVLAGLDSVVYESLGIDARQAMDRAANGTERAVRKALERASARGRNSSRAREPEEPKEAAASKARGASNKGALIGRREGRAQVNLEAALDRPEKRRRDAVVDTSEPGVSASDRRAGGGSTARRNTKRNRARATAALEDSAKSRPSRKSTRKSANRAKRDSNLLRRQTREATSPKARARRAQAKKR
ncbi:MAG TPA: HPF/RaiA family ribosome-associated protein [Labilithrix sp.]|nr:HPF/RaiA family ribosome-associated protein [Labilithrix sp.]